MASSQSARAAALIRKDQVFLERTGLRGARILGMRLRKKLLADAGRDDLRERIEPVILQFNELLATAMAAADLTGRARVLLSARRAKKASDVAGFGLALDPQRVYDRSIEILKRRLRLTNAQIEDVRSLYGDAAAQIGSQIGDLGARKVSRLVRDAIRAGISPRKATALLRKELLKSGIDPGNPYRLETIFQTQTQLTNSAARWQELQTPEIQALLWGYEYVTAGDDLVRPRHVVLEGVRLPKDDPRWLVIWPPNGWNCRCTTHEIFLTDSPSLRRRKSPRPKRIDGVLVQPVPDEGFDFNPGVVFGGSPIEGIATMN